MARACSNFQFTLSVRRGTVLLADDREADLISICSPIEERDILLPSTDGFPDISIHLLCEKKEWHQPPIIYRDIFQFTLPMRKEASACASRDRL